MYRKFFGLEKRPFVLSPDPDFLYMSKVHDLAFTHLEYGIVHNVGFLALTGDVGAGKTTLLKFLFERIRDSRDIAMLFNTNLTPEGLLEMLVNEYELQISTKDKTDLFAALSQHFLDRFVQGRRCVIMVDEAQNLPDETFEELRMLSNLEIGSDFLVQIILVGQPQLRQRLAQASLAQLAQRISVYYHLTGLSHEEVAGYIRHRLEVAGSTAPDSIFHGEAIDYIAELSRGIPRLINSICDVSLTYAFADEVEIVSKELVEKVVRDNPLIEFTGILAAPEHDRGVDIGGGHEIAKGEVDGQDLDPLIVRLYARVEALESRLRAIEASRDDRLADVLQTMLSKEREKNLFLEKKITALSCRYRALENSLKGQPRGVVEKGQTRKKIRLWGVFGGKK